MNKQTGIEDYDRRVGSRVFLRALSAGYVIEDIASVLGEHGSDIRVRDAWKIHCGERPLTVGEAAVVAGFLNVPLVDLMPWLKEGA